MRFLPKAIDERFLDHRRRATSLAGVVGAWVAVGLLAWRYFVDHRMEWDLLAVVMAVGAVKLAALIWYSLKD